jgi:ABC-type bacteriocin/lantibiotic exporter with double-glycine peptidase domain
MAVPHFYQSSEQTCGAACLRMLFAALGVAHDEATIAQHCRLTPLGCTVQDLIAGAQALGFNAALLPVSSEPAAIVALTQETPFVAMIDLASLSNEGPMFQWHFVVPLGLAQDEVTFHDPADGPDRRAKLDDFLAAWATAGYRGVRIWTP